MKRNKILTFILLAGIALHASSSCTRQEPDILVRVTAPGVPVHLSLSVTGMEQGTPGTKVVQEPDIIGEDSSKEQIKNFFVFQFEGDDVGAKLVANPDFYPDASKILDGTEQVNLLPTSRDHPGPFILVVLANRSSNTINAPSDMTLGQFLKDFDALESYSSVFTEGDNDARYLRMSGSVFIPRDQTIDENFSTTVNLKRNVSKVTIHVKNTTAGSDKVTIHQAQLQDINTKYYYLTHLAEGINARFEDSYSVTDPCRINKEREPFNETEQTFTYYVPANLRGTNASTHQYTKGLNAPDGATRFCLFGTYGPDNTPVIYTYYLGGNLTNDFNLNPNYHYTYNITVNSKDSRLDYRIEDMAEVRFHVDANCYMVHPPLVEGQERIYAIPIRRAAAFWNAKGENGGVYGASQWDKKDYSALQIHADTPWTAGILWSDFAITNPSDFLVLAEGQGYDPTDPNQSPYFKIKVKAGMKGNVIIAVKVNETIVWSWHIWITDYNPDREDLMPINGANDPYIYQVEGGHLHRYNNPMFKTHPTDNADGYYNGFIMDRPLGASGASFDELNGTMHYQYGRKDPFPAIDQTGALDRLYLNGNSHQTVLTVSRKKLRDATGEQDAAQTDKYGVDNVRYTVCNPMVFITARDSTEKAYKGYVATWTGTDGIVSNNSAPWLDPLFYDHGSTNGDSELFEKKKSIYDPCPPGWKVPFRGTFDNIEYVLGNATYIDKGMTYYPKGANDKGCSIYIQAVGNRWYTTGTLSNFVQQGSSLGRYWVMDNMEGSYDKGRAWTFHNTMIASQSLVAKTQGFLVRCVREYGVVVK